MTRAWGKWALRGGHRQSNDEEGVRQVWHGPTVITSPIHTFCFPFRMIYQRNKEVYIFGRRTLLTRFYFYSLVLVLTVSRAYIP